MTSQPPPAGRRLIICCDGTWNTPDQRSGGVYAPTNVARVAHLVKPRDGNGVEQLIYYQQGVGTFGWLDRITGGAFGTGLRNNIERAYRFIINNYRLGDELYLIGFSRGAYTARSLAGLIRNCGIVDKRCERVSERGEKLGDAVDRAIDIYYEKGADCRPDGATSVAFREKHCHPTEDREFWIRCIAVWDTVGALGVPIFFFRVIGRLLGWNPYQFHDVTLSSKIHHAYQALAVHEKRAMFAPAVWEMSRNRTERQVVEQTWFVGVHSDVGGGYSEPELSMIPLEWITARLAELGVEFEEKGLTDFLAAVPRGAEQLATAVLHRSRKGLYRLWFARERDIGVTSPETESLHQSVAEWVKTAEEVPENLRLALAGSPSIHSNARERDGALAHGSAAVHEQRLSAQGGSDQSDSSLT